MPAGGYKLCVDSSVIWVQPTAMAKDNENVTNKSLGKFNHWRGEGRDYFW
jgi:hypothetical protein